jgi:RNA polymerase sigma-B factor
MSHPPADDVLADLEDKSGDDVSRELFDRVQEDPAARDQLVAIYLPLAEYLARRFAGRGEPVEDLIQVASIGLIKAIDRFDTERGPRFSTYATPTIVGELKRHFRDKGWAIRMPRRLQEIGLQVRGAIAEAYQELGRSPTVSELANRTGLTQEQVLEAMETVRAYSVDSLDATDDDDDESRGNRIADEEDPFELLEAWAAVRPLIQALPERDRLVLYYRFHHQLTQSQIAEKLGISQMHVSRLLARTLDRLRAAVSDEPDQD